MRLRYWLLLAALVLAGCQRDPYRIKNYGDGGPPKLDGNPNDLPLTEKRPVDTLPDMQLDHIPSYDACRAIPEACNNFDDNCDGQTDEGFDKQNDQRYCENCKGCAWLLTKEAYPGCSNGTCVISSCKPGFVDLNKDAKDGCEYSCAPSGVEICDGEDNDCNGKVDDNVTLSQNICKDQGPCKGAKAVCKGGDGWQCEYDLTKGVELQTCTQDSDCGPGYKCNGAVCPGIVVTNEKKCDGVDGDCDGLADDPWANESLPNALGKECDTENPPKKGICRSVGVYTCDPTAQDKVYCKLTKAGVAPTDESCNGLDDDCDGSVDDLDLTKNPNAEKWVSVTGALNFKIFMYEASRPDATGTSEGIASDNRPCSVPGRLPWSTVSKEEAQTACEKAGARLCTTAEWKQACRAQANTLFPYGGSFDPTACNGRAYDTTKDAPLPTDKPGAACVSKWPAGDIFNMSGNLKEWTAKSFSGAKPSAYEIKGGAYDTPSITSFGAGLSCDYDLPAPASALRIPTLGFRCCK